MIDSLIGNPKLVIAILFSLIGFSITVILLYYVVKAKESNSWPTANGIILTSDVIKMGQHVGDSSPTYNPQICYSYKINGVEYISNRIRILFNYSSSNSSRAYKLTNKFKINSQVIVYYNPDKPDDSVLEPGLKNDNVIFLIIGIAILAVSLIFATKFGLFELINI